ncbi:MAG: hypothetical protein KO202_06790 [Methanobacteriaceae archaeon]|jgi:hypothetical protein|nr:hypothetical protein [Methanobacteriaceae archaeon]
MKKKIIIFIFLLTLISINSISATENLDDTEIDINHFNNENNIIDVNGDTFTDLDNAIQNSESGKTVNINKDITITNTEKITYKEGILVNKDNITIEGNGNKIDGDYSVRFFKIIGNNVIVKNLNFINGKSVSAGAIQNNGNNNCLINNTFENNIATTSAGVIHNSGDNFKIIGNNKFLNNLATTGSGGVIFNSGNDFKITGDNFFDGNIVELGVGAVIFNIGLRFIIEGNNTFQYNEAHTGSGTVIYNSGENFLINGTNKFRYNQAIYYGGVLYNNFTNNFSIIGSNLFEYNIATDGGAIYNTYGPNFVIKGNNIIRYNIVSNNGAGIYNLQGNNFSIAGNNIITNNEASSLGAGIFTSSTPNFRMVGSNILENNTAGSNGGGIYISGKNFLIEGNEFINNIALKGNSIFIAENGNLKLKNSKIKGIEYLIYNEGNLSLNNNSLNSNQETKIYNDGIIYSLIYLIFNENQTIAIKDNDFNLTGKITDDNRNIIFGKNITFDINKTKINSNNFINGFYIENYNFTKHGEYLISGSYNGGINKTILTGKIIKFKYNSYLTTNITESEENIIINIDLKGENNELLNATVYLNLNNKTIEVPILNGKGTYKIDYLPGGNYSLIANFKGKDIYGPSNDTINFTVYKQDLQLITKNIEIFYRNGVFYAILKDLNDNPLINSTVYFTINSQTYTHQTNETGFAKLSINLNPGNYSITTLFNGTKNLNKKEIKNYVFVKPTIIAYDVVKYYKNGTNYIVKVLDGNGNVAENINVSMNINGVNYTKKTNSEGIAILSINLNPGKYIITVSSPINGEKKNNNITVLSTLKGNDIDVYYLNGEYYEVKILDSKGQVLANKEVKMNINGIIYTKITDSNGIAKLKINLNPGKYIITTTNTNDDYKLSNKINVIPMLTGNNTVINHHEKGHYDVKLYKIINNTQVPNPKEKIAMNINGVIYERETNENGIARLNINLNPGNYIVTSYYKDYINSNKIEVI